MDDRDQPKQHYADVFDSEPGVDLLQMVGELHQAAVLCHQGEPSSAVDQAIAQLARQRRPAPAPNGTVDHAVDSDGPAPVPDNMPRVTRSRSEWFRQSLGMVAAIAVILLVGGILAVTFRSQPKSQQGGIGGRATATAIARSQLPQTVVASGLRITLSSAKLNGSQIVLTFKIESADPNHPNMWTIGGGEFTGLLVPENDVVVTGLKWDAQSPETSVSPLVPPGFKPPPPAPSPTPQPIPDIVGYQEALPFVLTGPAEQPVTVTIQKVRFDNGPSTPPPGKIINGTWSFTFVPALLGAPPLPTPDRFGSYDRLSLAQAQRLVNFTIAIPNPLPDVLQPLPNSIFSASAVGSTGSAKANYVTFYYPAVNMAEKGVSVLETSSESAVPTLQGNTIQWVGENGKTTAVPASQVTQSDLTINGVRVTKWDTKQQGVTVVYYLWEKAGVHFVAYTVPKIQVTEAVMEQFVKAMISPLSATPQTRTTPTPPFVLPTPNAEGQTILTFEQAQQLAPFYVAKPQWVPSYLVDEGIEVPQWQGAEPPGSPVQEITLSYRGQDSSHQINVQISEELEHVPRSYANASTPVSMTIAGHEVTRTDIVAVSGTPIEDYLWHEQGTTFEFTGTVAGPLTEQDLEHMIASMLQTVGTSATPQAQATPVNSSIHQPMTTAFYKRLTFNQAQSLVSFRLIEPTWLPSSLSLVDVQGIGPPLTDPTTGGPIYIPTPMTSIREVSLVYGPGSLSVLESPTPISSTYPGLPTTTSLYLGGQPVTRTVYSDGALSYENLTWEEYGTYVVFFAEVRGTVTEQDVEHMIASMLDQSADSATPAPSGRSGPVGTGSNNKRNQPTG